MASARSDPGKLTSRQIVGLGREISKRNMKSIAEGYLDIDHEVIKSLVDSHREDTEDFNRELIRRWASKPENSGPDQVKVGFLSLTLFFKEYLIIMERIV